MFEELDADVLRKLSTIDGTISFRKDTSLDTLLDCLESARKECSADAGSSKFSSQELVELNAGFFAAQKIVSHLWTAEVEE